MCGSGFNALGPKNGQNRYTTPNNILDALIIHQVIQVNKKYWVSSQVHLVNLLNPEDLHHVDLHCVVFLFSSFLADYMNWVSWRNEGRPLSVPFLICTSRKGTDMATTLELEKSRRIDFSLGRWSTRGKTRPNRWGNMSVEPWDLAPGRGEYLENYVTNSIIFDTRYSTCSGLNFLTQQN